MQRDTTIDTARGLALLLAMLSHCFIQFDVWSHVDDTLRLLTRAATPTFLVLFGITLELVYVRKWRQGDPKRTISTLVARAVTCYVVFGLVTLAALLTGKLSFVSSAKAMLYLDNGRFGVILKLYALLFAVIPLVLSAYMRRGPATLAAIAATGWLVKFGLDSLDRFPDSFPLTVLFGTGTGYGPALWPSLTLVVFGIMLGRIRVGKSPRRIITLIVAASAAVLVLGATDLGIDALSRGITSGHLRADNHPYYFAYGGLAALAIVATLDVVRNSPLGRVIPSFVSTIGRKSLFAYGFGNILINLLPTYKGSFEMGLLLSLAFMGALTLITLDLSRIKPRLDYVGGHLLSAFMRFWTASFDRLGCAIGGKLHDIVVGAKAR